MADFLALVYRFREFWEWTPAVQKRLHIPRTVNYAHNFYAIEHRQIQDKHSLETLHSEYAQGFEIGMSKAGIPPHLGLLCEKGECLMGSQ